ncbi:hypothetical protein CEW89_08435 [Celeribacter ethanolicus]|uniref:Phage gp6-like head-tail connector protein n=1 Tax=Celeribacter ethanolicus TaxID=1758178 RepID=A0A291GC27_9RHOB|nr:head-tail connector protein [Celeribacter ethanolicus]ATG47600.1 hypothetical protein CEW89_08435 [Celeribacter ethanolicus]
MSLSVITPPAASVYSASDDVVRQHLRIGDDETDNDTLINSICASAEQAVETYTRRRMITQEVRYTLDGFPCRRITLPVDPIQSVSAVSYLDGSGSWVELASDSYRLLEGNAICPAYGKTWPVPQNDFETVRIDMIVGYGDEKGDVPPQILAAMRFLIAHMYLNDEAVVVGKSVSDLPLGVRDMLDPWRFWV